MRSTRTTLPMIMALATMVLVAPVIATSLPTGGDKSPGSGSSLETEAVRIALSGLISLGAGVFSLFVGRREYTVRLADIERRVQRVEDYTPTDESVSQRFAVAQAQHDSLAARLDQVAATAREDVGGLHEKINAVAINVAAVETETRLQTRTLNAIAQRLEINAP